MTTLPSFNLEGSLLACHRQDASGCIKIVEDLARYEQILAMSRPDIIVECGTWMGYSARWFAEHDVKVITIDIEPRSSDRPYTRWVDVPVELRSERITYIIGETTNPRTVDRIFRLCEEKKKIMVVLDSDHSADHVEQEIKLYGPLVTPGHYLVVEDGILRWLPSNYVGNPLDAIERTLINNPQWERATDIEEMFDVTLYPAGFWRRTVVD